MPEWIDLGFDQSSVVTMHASLAVTGIAIGLAAAWALTRLLSKLLFGVSPHDPATFAAIAAIFACVAFLASSLPGWRPTRVDPLETVRDE